MTLLTEYFENLGKNKLTKNCKCSIKVLKIIYGK